jgi:hypothetical protein
VPEAVAPELELVEVEADPLPPPPPHAVNETASNVTIDAPHVGLSGFGFVRIFKILTLCN